MKNNFVIPLGLSVGIHLLVLAGPSFSLPGFKKETSKKTQVRFIPSDSVKVFKKIRRPYKKENFSKAPPYLDLKKQLLTLKKINRVKLRKPLLLKKSNFLSKEILLSKPREKLDSLPAYVNYYENIREKIRKNAYVYYQEDFSGKVSLSFVLDNKGRLIQVETEDRQVSYYLRTIALKSIEEASPFPEFPPELEKYKTLAFKLTIHFKKN